MAGFIAWTIAILSATLMNDPTQSESGGWVKNLLETLSLPQIFVAKSFHFTAYAFWAWLLLGLCAGGYLRPIERRWLGICFMMLAAMACLQEGLQFLNPTRHPALMDVGINILGGLFCFAARPRLLAMAFSLTPRSRLSQP